MASQMYVGSKKDEKVTGDGSDTTGRLTNNGMNRDRTDKNAVADDHDFAALRGQLGKKAGGAPKTDSAKLEAARARTGHEAGNANFSNQMFTGGKPAQKPVEVKSGDRLTNNGMNRDRTDKNTVSDDHDFAALRAGLKKTK